jgi:hypothetical protein
MRKEMKGLGTAHFHSAIHVKDAPKLDIDPVIADKSNISNVNCLIRILIQNCMKWSSRQCHHHTRTSKKTSNVFVHLVSQNVPLTILLFQEFQKKKMQIPKGLCHGNTFENVQTTCINKWSTFNTRFFTGYN